MQHYRPDIDGLRALAVVPVVLFHAGAAGFSGGYVGVDVFFVISGYLITSVILKDQAEGRFSILSFYERRIRRIIPALLVVMATTLMMAALVMLPSDLEMTAKSAVAALLFVSNIFFWRSGGYFGGESDEKPFLHTWSLAVEEQYYILFPILMILVFRMKPRLRIVLLTLLAAGSLGVAVLGMQMNKALPVFYLLPSRAWELLIGAILACGAVPGLGRKARSIAGAVGCGLILFAVFTYTDKTPFPGLAALPPCVGAFLIILAGRDGDHLLTRVLTDRRVVFLGLISYSLYLWHWPVLVFMRYVAIRPLSPIESAVAVLLSVALGVLSWRYVEAPFRRGMSIRRVGLVTSAAAAVMAVGACGLIVADGAPSRFSPEVNALNAATGTMYKCEVTDYVPFGTYYGCPVNLASRDPSRATALIWGDSHAQMYIPGIEPLLKARGLTGFLVPMNGCPPLATQNVNHACWTQNERNFQAIRRHSAGTVILAMNWAGYRDIEFLTHDGHRPGDRFSALVGALDETVQALRASGKRVVIVGPIPTPGYPLASVASRSLAYGRGMAFPVNVPAEAFEDDFRPVFAYLAAASSDPGVVVYYPHRRLCGRVCDFIIDGRPIFADGGHLTADYARTLKDFPL